MPALYAHNQFGNRVLQQLQGANKEIATKYLRYFRIGLQGPDFLFFYKPLTKNPISEIGHEIHRQPAKKFLMCARQVIKVHGTDSPEYAYLMGFICHFALDSECHPFVSSEIKRTGVKHVEIESEFEKLLMRKDGLDPLSFPVGKTFPADKKTAKCIVKFYEGVEEKEAYVSLRSMRFCKQFLVAPGKLKHNLIDLGMKLTGEYEKYQGHLLKAEDNPLCEESNAGLYSRFLNAVPVAVRLIEKFDSYLDGNKLDSRFDRNFS